tara:strand:+ start:1616 stop:2452 length:837 start_codon:yes stop_codon:yes gene_type:complete
MNYEANPNDPRTEYQDTNVNLKDYKAFDPVRDLPDSFICGIIASRRSGKSFLINNMIQQFQKSKRKFTHVFLISSTGAGFEGIPDPYRFDNMSALDYIIDNQVKIKDFNESQKKKENMYPSRVCVVIDDMAAGNGLKNHSIESMAIRGRHYGENDFGLKGNGINIFILSQSLTKISRTTRLNLDAFMLNNISSLKERDMILDESFYVDTSRKAKRSGRDVFEALVKSKDFRFIVINNYIQNKRDLKDYIMTFDAKHVKPFKFFGDRKDWIGNKYFPTK